MTLLKSVQSSLRNDDLCETPAQHTLQTVISGTFSVVFDTHAAAIRPIQHGFLSKTAVCRVARPSGESNAREWWVSVRVFRGLSVQVVCCLVGFCLQISEPSM